MKAINLTGKRYGRLSVLHQVSIKIEGRPGWLCLCDCGKTVLSNSSRLNSGKIKSCGCLAIERSIVHGLYGTNEYYIWSGLISRCENKKNKDYHKYGARGIKVCDKWRKDFSAFYKDMGQKPTKKHQIDRENNNGNYTPNNCRWVLPKTNACNRRDSKWWYVRGNLFNSAKEAAIKHGVSDTTIIAWCQGRKRNGRKEGPKPFCFSVRKYEQETV